MSDFEVNPYAPAVPRGSRGEPVDDAIEFKGVVRRKDIERFGRDGMRTYARCLAWTMTAGFYVSIFMTQPMSIQHALQGNGAWIETSYGRALISVAFIVQLVASTWGTMWMLGYLYARSHIAAAPELLGPISGTLRGESLELVCVHARSVIPLAAISEVRRSAGAIGFLIGEDCESLVVMPRHLFEGPGFAEASDRLTAAVAASRSMNNVVSRSESTGLSTGQAVPPADTPLEDAEAFASGLLLSDCQWTPIRREQVVRIYGVAGCALANAMMSLLPIAIALPVSMMGWHAFMLVIRGVVLLVLVHIVAAFWRLWTLKSSTSSPVAGWVARDGLTIKLPIGCTTYRPIAFRRVDSSDRSVQLTLRGRPRRTFVLSKPMFESAAGFDRLRIWATSKAGATSAESG